MKQERIEEWHKIYLPLLKENMYNNPSNYMPNVPAETIASKLKKTLEERGVGAISIQQSFAWRKSAKYFGIKNTYKDWTKWFDS